MLHRIPPGLVAFALVVPLGIAAAQSSTASNRVLVRFESEQARLGSEFQGLRTTLGATLLRRTLAERTYVYELLPGADAEQTAERIARVGGVRQAAPDTIFTLPSSAPAAQIGPGVTRRCFPDDPLFPEQWPLHNTGQLGGTVDADIDAPEAWCLATDASPVVVAISDTGIDYTHPDLVDNLWTNEAELNGLPDVDDDGNGFVDDVHGFDFVHDAVQNGVRVETEDPPDGPFDDHYHGTASAGTIAAHGDDGIGISGVAWSARIMAVKAMNEDGSGYLSNIYDSVIYAVDNGAQVINCSWIAGFNNPFMRDAIEYARDHDVMCVAAAGNSYANIDEDPSDFGYPGVYDYANQITVGATDVDDYNVGNGPRGFEWSYGSNWGPESVQVSAPGVAGATTEPLWRGNGGYRFTWGGTSMAMPHVVGLAALAWAQDTGQDIATVRQRIVDAVDGKSQLDGFTETGGRVNLHQLLRADGGPPGPVSNLFAYGLWFDRTSVSWREPGGDGPFGLPTSRYDLRWSTDPVTPQNFDTATSVVGEPQPVSSTATAYGLVDGLEPDTLYHFLLKVRDHHGNEGFSNPTSARTQVRLRVDDLAVTGEGVGFVDLAFTLPTVVTLSLDPIFTDMDVRYALEPIDESNFANAIHYPTPPLSGVGSTVSVHVSGLQLDTEYWFAVVLNDVYGQQTLVSNTVAGTSRLPTTTVFFDDMESGAGGWVSDGNWGLTDERAHSGTWSWTDSPGGDFPPNREATLVSPSMDLSGLTSASLLFNEVLLPNLGESVYVETSTSSAPWVLLQEIDIYEVHGYWQLRVIDMTALAGAADVRLRFRFVSDANYEDDGWYIDDVLVGGD